MKRGRPSFLAAPPAAQPPLKKHRHDHIKQTRHDYTPDWIKGCGVSSVELEKVFWYMRQKGYTATNELPGCVCMDACVGVCCTDDMAGREALCTACAHVCSECGDPNLEIFKSAKDAPVCYMCARYSYGDQKIWWEDTDWAVWEKKNKDD